MSYKIYKVTLSYGTRPVCIIVSDRISYKELQDNFDDFYSAGVVKASDVRKAQ